VSLEAHQELVSFLKEHESEIMVDTLTGIADHIRKSGEQ
jgi:hypothetical protein